MPPGGMQAWSVFGTIGLNGLGATAAKLNAFNSMGKATSTGLLGMSGKAKIAAAGLTAFGLAAGAASVASVKAFADFDEKMTASLAIMGDVTSAMREDMSDAARDVGRTTQFSAEQAAEAYFFLASAGLNAQQSIAAMPQVAAFATAGQFDLATATDLLTDAQSALGLTVQDTNKNLENMARVSDVLVKANTLANATVEQFSQSLTTQAGASLKAFNKDIEEGVAVLAAMADQGIKAQRAGTGLSRLMRFMSQNWHRNKQAFKEMNIEVFDSQGQFNNLADIIGDLENALGDLSPEMKTSTLLQLGFSARVQQTILPLLGTADAIAQYELELEGAKGVTEEVANKQLKTFNKQLGLLGSELKDIGIGIGSFLTPALTGLVMMLNDVINKAREAAHWLGIVGEREVTNIDPRDKSTIDAQFGRMDDEGVKGTEALRNLFEESRELGRLTVNEARAIADAWEEPIPVLGANAEKMDILSDWPPQLRSKFEDASLKVVRAMDKLRIAAKEVEETLPPLGGGGAGAGLGMDSEVDAMNELSSQASAMMTLLRERRRAGESLASVWAGIFDLHKQITTELQSRQDLTAVQEANLLGSLNNLNREFNRLISEAPIPSDRAESALSPERDIDASDIHIPDVKPLAQSRGEDTGNAFAEGFKEQAGPAMIRAGEQIIFGLIQGTSNVEAVLKRVLASIITSAIMSPLQNAFAFGSPSRVMESRGEDIIMGLAHGMRRASPFAESAMHDVARRVSAMAPAGAPAMAGLTPRGVQAPVRGFGATNELTFSIKGPSIPPPKDPRQSARDREWQKHLRESLLVAEAGGFRRMGE